MNLSFVSWNGVNINNGSPFYSVFPPVSKANLSSTVVSVRRAGDYPFLSTTVPNAATLTINVRIAAGQDIDTNRELLKKYFNVLDPDRHNLIAADAADSNRQYYVTGMVTQVVGDKLNYAVTFALEADYWKLVTATADNWSITASGQTKAITNIGNIKVKPSFAFTPTTTKTGGLTYRRWVPIYNRLDKAFVGPYDITDGGLDTAALTTAKMQADGDDFLVMMDAQFVDRWLNGMDSAATQCWVNLSLSAKQEGTTNTSIAASGAITTITLSKTKANKAFLQAMAKAVNKVVLIDSEAFTFTGVNLVTYQLTGVTRARKDTAEAAHTAPKTVRWIEHDIWILHGDSTLTAPDVNDDNKPLFSLASTNEEWIYTNFYDTSTSRPGAWSGGVVATRNDLSYVYTANENTFISPSTELGIAVVGNQTELTTQIESATVEWRFSHPAGITAVGYSGSKYATELTAFPAIVGLQYLVPDTIWQTQRTEGAPSAALTWEAFGAYTETLPDTFETIRFVIDGAVSPTTGAAVLAQFDTVSVSFDTDNLPVSSIGAETAINWFDFTLTNNTTGEYIKVAHHCLEDGTLTVDCENKKAYLDDLSRVAVTLSTDREAWLDLASGSNTLQYDDTGTNAVSVVVTHRDRSL